MASVSTVDSKANLFSSPYPRSSSLPASEQYPRSWAPQTLSVSESPANPNAMSGPTPTFPLSSYAPGADVQHLPAGSTFAPPNDVAVAHPSQVHTPGHVVAGGEYYFHGHPQIPAPYTDPSHSVSPSPAQGRKFIPPQGGPARTQPTVLRRARASSTPYGPGFSTTSPFARGETILSESQTSLSAHASPLNGHAEVYDRSRVASLPASFVPPQNLADQSHQYGSQDPSAVHHHHQSGPHQGHALFGSDGYAGSTSEHSVTDEEWDSRRSSVASSVWSAFDVYNPGAQAPQQSHQHPQHIHQHQPVPFGPAPTQLSPSHHSHSRPQVHSELAYTPQGPAGSGMGLMYTQGRQPMRRPSTTATAYHPGAFGGVPPQHIPGEMPRSGSASLMVRRSSYMGGGMEPQAYLAALAQEAKTSIPTNKDRAKAAFVQAWLTNSYEAHPDGRVSRQGLYASYHRACEEYDIAAINSASFGKAVRQAFKGNIGTRRLGVRGNSKYHYVGIRPANDKEAERLAQCSASSSNENEASGSSSSHSVNRASSDEPSDGHEADEPMLSFDDGLAAPDSHYEPITPTTARPGNGQTQSEAQSAALRHRRHQTQAGVAEPYPTPNTSSSAWTSSSGWQAFADSRTARAELPNIEEVFGALTAEAAAGLDVSMARSIWAAYKEHVKKLVESMQQLRFEQFELALRGFWEPFDEQQRATIQHPVMMELFYKGDSIVYDDILDFVHGHTLQPMPAESFAALRALADGVEQTIIISMQSFSPEFVRPKIELGARFGHLLLRHIGICALAQALQNVLSKPGALHDMHEAWMQIDFETVRNQCALVTNCQHDVLSRAFDDFKEVLADPSSKPLEHFINFVEAAYQTFLAPGPNGEKMITPRSLLVRWSFVSSQLMRDLTLRSSPAFGSFQLLSTFFEDWISFWTLRKVALHVGAVAPSSEVAPASNDPFEPQASYLAITPAPQHAQAPVPRDTPSSHQSVPTVPIPVFGNFQDTLNEPFSPRTSAALADAMISGQTSNAGDSNAMNVEHEDSPIGHGQSRQGSIALDGFQSLSVQSPAPEASVSS